MNQQSSTGLDPRLAAALAYFAWWVSGAAVLALERRSGYVRFHAWQAVVALGGIWAVGAGLYLGAFLMLSISASGFTAMVWLAMGVWGAGVVLWAVCLRKAYAGERWKAPLAGRIAQRLASRISSTASA